MNINWIIVLPILSKFHVNKTFTKRDCFLQCTHSGIELLLLDSGGLGTGNRTRTTTVGLIRLVRPIADFRANTASLAEAAELAG